MLRTTPPFRADHVGSLLRPQYLKDARARRERGEFRRAFWHLDFMEGLDGVESYQAEQGIVFQGGVTKPVGLRVTGKIGVSTHPMIDHFRFLKAHTKATPKMTIPSPSV